MLRIQQGARIFGLSNEMQLGCTIIYSVFEEFGLDCILTHGSDGVHTVGSLHYSGNGCDFGSHHVESSKKVTVRDKMKLALGEDFDVLLEDLGQPNEHYHVEYQPKRSY